MGFVDWAGVCNSVWLSVLFDGCARKLVVAGYFFSFHYKFVYILSITKPSIMFPIQENLMENELFKSGSQYTSILLTSSVQTYLLLFQTFRLFSTFVTICYFISSYPFIPIYPSFLFIISNEFSNPLFYSNLPFYSGLKNKRQSTVS